MSLLRAIENLVFEAYEPSILLSDCLHYKAHLIWDVSPNNSPQLSRGLQCECVPTLNSQISKTQKILIFMTITAYNFESATEANPINPCILHPQGR